MTKKLAGQCRSFIIANLLRVISSEGWTLLIPTQQEDIKEGELVFIQAGTEPFQEMKQETLEHHALILQ